MKHAVAIEISDNIDLKAKNNVTFLQFINKHELLTHFFHDVLTCDRGQDYIKL